MYTYVYVYTYTHTHIYIYIYIYICNVYIRVSKKPGLRSRRWLAVDGAGMSPKSSLLLRVWEISALDCKQLR